MKKVLNWTVGSMFRTIGRFFGLLLISIIFGYILIKSNVNITDLLGISSVKALSSNFNTEYIKMRSYGGSEVNIYSNSGPYTISTGHMEFEAKFNVAGPIQNDWYWTMIYICSNQPIYVSGSSWNIYPQSRQTLTVGQACQIDSTTGGILYIIPVKHGSTFSASCTDSPCPFYSTGWSITTENAKIKFSSVEVMDESRYQIFRDNMLILDSNDKNTLDIINDAQQNAQNIIDNANQNAQNIIDNQNQNSQNEIASQNVCRVIDNKTITNIGYLGNNGVFTSQSSGTNRTTDFIPINSQSSFQLYKQSISSNYNYRYCFYNSSKSYISCAFNQSQTEGSNITIPLNAKYLRFTINLNGGPQYQICSNGNQAINDSLNNLSDTLNDDNVSNSEIENSLNFSTTENAYGPFATFLTLPLQWVQDILASNQTCRPLSLPLPYVNRNLDLPCMTDFWNNMGAVGTLVQLCWVAVVGVRIFNGLFKLVVDTTSSEDNAEELTKIRSWEL